jgi:hypothetical protein
VNAVLFTDIFGMFITVSIRKIGKKEKKKIQKIIKETKKSVGFFCRILLAQRTLMLPKAQKMKMS